MKTALTCRLVSRLPIYLFLRWAPTLSDTRSPPPQFLTHHSSRLSLHAASTFNFNFNFDFNFNFCLTQDLLLTHHSSRLSLQTASTWISFQAFEHKHEDKQYFKHKHKVQHNTLVDCPTQLTRFVHSDVCTFHSVLQEPLPFLELFPFLLLPWFHCPLSPITNTKERDRKKYSSITSKPTFPPLFFSHEATALRAPS